MFVIAGASGVVGRVVAESLLSGGREVRVIVRDRERATTLDGILPDLLSAQA